MVSLQDDFWRSQKIPKSKTPIPSNDYFEERIIKYIKIPNNINGEIVIPITPKDIPINGPSFIDGLYTWSKIGKLNMNALISNGLDFNIDFIILLFYIFYI